MLSQVMTKKVVTVESCESVRRAIQIMVEKDIGNVVVVQKSRPIGIFTERDLMKLCAQGKDALEAKIGSVMSSRPLISAAPDPNPLEALLIMHRNKIRRLPVVENGRLVGIVTEKDLVHWVINMTCAPSAPHL